MRDAYYIRSLASTVLAVIFAMALLFGAIYLTGFIGLAVLALAVLACFAFYYGWFRRFRGSENRSVKRLPRAVKYRY